MLKNTDPLLNPDLLYILAAMGHGDEIAIVDANFPAESMGERTVRLDGVNATRALDAVLTVLPLDDFVERPAAVMQVVGDADAEPETVREFKATAAAAEGRTVEFRGRRTFRILRSYPRDFRRCRHRRAPSLRQRHPGQRNSPSRLGNPREGRSIGPPERARI